MHKRLMKITSAYVGFGGYDGAMMGIWICFGNEDVRVCDGSHGFWHSERSEMCKWTDQDRIKYFGELIMQIAQWLREAKIKRVEELVGIPVEVTFDKPFGHLESWRILTEVL